MATVLTANPETLVYTFGQPRSVGMAVAVALLSGGLATWLTVCILRSCWRHRRIAVDFVRTPPPPGPVEQRVLIRAISVTLVMIPLTVVSGALAALWYVPVNLTLGRPPRAVELGPAAVVVHHQWPHDDPDDATIIPYARVRGVAVYRGRSPRRAKTWVRVAITTDRRTYWVREGGDGPAALTLARELRARAAAAGGAQRVATRPVRLPRRDP